MNPDFTFIWPLSCLKDGDHLCRKHVGSGLLALICVGLGDTDRALSYLQHAAEEREVVMTMLQRLFVYDPLRSDPRFQALLKKMNFPQQA